MSRSRSTRRLLAVALIALLLAVAGCGAAAKKALPPGPPAGLSIKVISAGTGPTVVSGDSVTVDYQGLIYSTGKIFDQSYGKQPATFKTSSVVPGFGAALVGQKVGSKIIVSIPPKYGYGTSGNPNAGISGRDTIVFVIEIRDTKGPSMDCTVKPGAASNGVTVSGAFGKVAKPTFAKSLKAPKVERTVVVAGTGAETKAGDVVDVLLTVYNARTGKKLQAQTGQLQAGAVDVPAVFEAGVACVKAGSRVVTTVPVKDLPGTPAAGIKPTDTLILITDIIKIAAGSPPAALPATVVWTNAPAVTFHGTQPPTVTFPK